MAENPLLKALSQAATSGALAQAEQITGIPFFQQDIARQDKKAAIQEDKVSNQARLKAGLNTGLVTAADVESAGGEAALVGSTSFNAIYGDLLRSKEIAARESKETEGEREAAVLQATQLQLTDNPDQFTTHELNSMSASELGKRDQTARETDQVATDIAAFEKAIGQMKSDTNPNEETVQKILVTRDAQLERLAAKTGMDPSTRAAQASRIQETADAAARAVQDRIALNAVVSGPAALPGNPAETPTTLVQRLSDAQGNPALFDAAMESADAAKMNVALDEKLRSVESLRANPDVLETLRGDAKFTALVGIVDQIPPNQSLDARVLIREYPELADTLLNMDTTSLSQDIARAQAETRDLLSAIEQKAEQSKRAAASLPVDSVAHDVFKRHSTDVQFGGIELQLGNDGTFQVVDNTTDPIIQLSNFLGSSTDDDALNETAELLDSPFIGGVAIPPGVRDQARRTQIEVFNRSHELEREARELARIERTQDTLEKSATEHGRAGDFDTWVTSGEASETSRALVTEVGDSLRLSQEAASFTERALKALPDSAEQQNFLMAAQHSKNQAEVAQSREAVMDVTLNGLLILGKVAPGDHADLEMADALIAHQADWLAQRVGSALQPGTPLGGAEAFKAAMSAEDISLEDQIQSYLEFVDASSSATHADSGIVLDGMLDYLDNKNDLAVSYLSPDIQAPTLRGASFDAQVAASQRPTPERMASLDIRFGGSPVKLSKKQGADDELVALLVAISTLQRR